MTTAISTWLLCIARFGSALLVLAVLILGLVLPWQERNHFYQDRIDQLTDQLSRFNKLIAALPALEQQLTNLKTNKELDEYYLPAKDGNLGGIVLQRRIEEFVRAANVTIISAQVLPPEEQPTAIKVGLRLRFGCSIEALWQIVYTVESNKPFLIIPVLTVRAMRQSPIRQMPGMPPDTTPDLNVNMDIYGYIRRSAT